MRKYIYTIICVLFSVLCYGQKHDKYIKKQLDMGIALVERNDYVSSITCFQNALDQAIKDYGANSTIVMACKSQLANSYYNLNHYEEALHLFVSVAEFQQAKYGGKSKEYATQLDHVAACYYELDDYDNAILFVTKAIEIHLLYFSPDDLDYIFSLNDLSTYYSMAGIHEKAISVSETVLNIVKEYFGEDGGDYITAIEELADCYRNAERYDDAIVLGLDSSKRNEKFYGKHSYEFANSLLNLSLLYYLQENLALAIKYAKEVEGIYSKIDVPSSNYITLYDLCASILYDMDDLESSLVYRLKEVSYIEAEMGNNLNMQSLCSAYYSLAKIYYRKADNTKALEYANKALPISKAINDHSMNVSIMIHQSKCYDELGQITKAVSLSKEALTLIDNHCLSSDLKLEALSALGCYYDNLGHYEKAIEVALKTYNFCVSEYGCQSLEVSEVLTNLGAFYMRAGNYSKSIEYLKEAISIYEAHDSQKDYSTGYLYATLARAYDAVNDKDNSLIYTRRALEYFALDKYPKEHTDVLELMYLSKYDDVDLALNHAKFVKKTRAKYLGKNHIRYTYSLNNIAFLYARKGNYRMAIKYDKQALRLRKKYSGADNHLYVGSLHNLAYNYHVKGNLSKSLELNLEANSIAKKIYDPYSPDLSYSLYTVADNYYQMRQYDLAIPYIKESLSIEKQILIQSIKGLNASHKESLWESSRNRIERLTHFCVQLAHDPEMAQMAYDAVLTSKGLLLKSKEEFNRIISNCTDEELHGYIQEYNQLRIEIASSKQKNDSIYNRLMDLESYLLKENPDLRKYQSALEVTWEDVRDRLKDNEVAIEFYLDDYMDFNAYCAMLIKKGWESPKVKYLFTKEFVDSLNVMGHQMYSDEFSEIAYNGIWAPLQEYVSDSETIYFSTDGLLHQTNIEVIGLDVEQSITNRCNLIRLSSTRELCNTRSYTKPSTAVIYGGLQYEVDSLKLRSLHEKYSSIYQPSLRSLCVDSTRTGWEYLPYSKLEAETINSKLKEANVDALLFMQDEGTEESFKALSGSQISIVHIATHGFFLKNSEQNSSFLIDI